jgi:hypothetical protein
MLKAFSVLALLAAPLALSKRMITVQLEEVEKENNYVTYVPDDGVHFLKGKTHTAYLL